ncbi:uncharacterized protein LOC120111742 [Phoenix dactylifera]|uniref:Protein FAR1-RELATED SEQUENCE n=1 Tax=Phoenix dactylifera TaxID=42345 RepID=A0A8B9AQF3_PHODC|nr:uncharacterized protein LOC120111742 [Phoenix dactylifera]
MSTIPFIDISEGQSKRICPCGSTECYLSEERHEESTRNFSVYEDGDTSIFPYAEQSFNSDNDVYMWYSNFARKNGFSIRRNHLLGGKNHPLGVYWRELVCHSAGKAQPSKVFEVERQRNRKSSRCGCGAKMIISKDIVDGVCQWKVPKFDNVHNHELLKDNEVRFLPAYRDIDVVDQQRIKILSKAGCSIKIIMRVLELEKGLEPGNLPFTNRDVRNLIHSQSYQGLEDDALELLKLCKSLKDQDADFCYDFTVDENQKLQHIICSFGDSVRAYQSFGDVLVFDTTYRGRYNDFKAEFYRLYHLESIEYFEKQWDNMVCQFGLASDRHIGLLFSHRACWALPYLRDFFLARMTTTGRSESINSFLKAFLNARTSLKDFVEQMGIAMSVRNRAGEEAAMHQTYLNPSIKTSMPMEEHASSIFTPYAFELLQNEMVLSYQYAAIEMRAEIYTVRHCTKNDGGRFVTWDQMNEEIHCSCKEFEFSESSKSKGRAQCTNKELQKLISLIRGMPIGNDSTLELKSCPVESLNRDDCQFIRNPEPSKTKGRPKGKRLGGGVEVAKEPRRCHVPNCGGTNHDSRNCPNKKRHIEESIVNSPIKTQKGWK